MTVFKGRVALVTGGASGIGAACARLLAERGAGVIDADRDVSAAQTLVASLAGEDHAASGLDVTDPAVVQALFDGFDGHGRPPDILINGAGIREIVDLPVDECNRVLSVNLSGSFYCCQAFARGLRVPGGAAGRSSTLPQQPRSSSLLAAPRMCRRSTASWG